MAAVLHEQVAMPALVRMTRTTGAPSVAAERLADMQLAFNLFPALYAHSSWLPMAQPCADAVRHLPLWVRAQSSALLRSEGLERHFDCDFFDPAKRLALLDAASLIRVAGLVSAVLLREKLRRIVRQAEVRAAQDCMGAEAHQFAVHWTGALAAVSPAIDPARWPTTQQWARDSVAQLMAAIPLHAIGVLGRLKWRFARDWQLPERERSRLTELQRVGLTRLVIAVIAASAPQWSWLFEQEPAVRQLAASRES